MSVLNIITIHGHCEISKGVTKNDLLKLATNPNTQSIQLASPLADTEIDLLESEVFSRRPDIVLRVYGHYRDNCDLSFLERIPSLRKVTADCLMDASGIETVTQLKNLESLGIGIFSLDNFDFLEDINPHIKKLYLHQTRSKKPNIECIARFKDIEYLYLEGQQKGIESIANLKNLHAIVLRSISTKNIDFLEGLKNLWSVDIKLGGIKSFDALTTLPQMKYLELWQIRGLADISFISKLSTLQNLYLQSLKQVDKLPDFSINKSLRRIYLENLKGLNDLSTLRNAPSLKEFIYVMAENQEPENMIPALENPVIESVLCGFGSDKKNRRFEELAVEYNKKEYKYNEFKYN